jgi:glutamate formiminotransferase
VLECVVNVSEGRKGSVIEAIAASGENQVLDVHTDRDHNRAVVTMAGSATEGAVRELAHRAVELVDVARHSGVHPRLGALDVVPFVPLDEHGSPVFSEKDLAPALEARDRFARWAADELGLPCFVYGPERSLPELRKRAFVDLEPDFGPPEPHPTAGACAVGARPALVAYNLWLSTSDVRIASRIARSIRSPQLRALGLLVGTFTQVSCNLVDPLGLGPRQVYDSVLGLARESGTHITHAELVGLAPRAVVEAVERARRRQLDLDLERTIEARVEARREALR